jgi:hypothetical protein
MRRYKTRRSPRLIVLQSCPHPFSRQQRATYRASIVGSVVFSLLKIVGGPQFPRPCSYSRAARSQSCPLASPVSAGFPDPRATAQVFSYLNASQLLETVVPIKPTTVLEDITKGLDLQAVGGRALPTRCGVEVSQSMVGG